jgi:U3 small nucleolar RNA-associated protein 19
MYQKSEPIKLPSQRLFEYLPSNCDLRTANFLPTMPHSITRESPSHSASEGARKRQKSVNHNDSGKDATAGDQHIYSLEKQILQSRTHYNNIAHLISILSDKSQEDVAEAYKAAAALCRVFHRLALQGSLAKVKGAPESEILIVEWLRTRYKDFVDILVQHLEQRPRERQVLWLPWSLVG